MSAEVDRLTAWLDSQQMSSQVFSESLGYIQNKAWRILTGEKPISRSFKWMFARKYGDELAATIFDKPVPASAKYGSDYYPERLAAASKTALISSRKVAPPARLFWCYGCKKKPAAHNHHPSYDPDRRLWVIPLCRSCHVRVHNGSLDLQLPIAPELVRIAIASPA